MRVVAALSLSLILLVGTHYYTRFADSVRRSPTEVATVFDDGDWALQIETTFNCVADPDFDRRHSLLVQLKGVDIFSTSQSIKAGEKTLIESIEGVEVGDNDFFIDVNLAKLDDLEFAESSRPGAIKVTLIRGARTVSENTFWVPPGETFFDNTIVFAVDNNSEPDGEHNDHDH